LFSDLVKKVADGGGSNLETVVESETPEVTMTEAQQKR
jgi:hypothetical protein